MNEEIKKRYSGYLAEKRDLVGYFTEGVPTDYVEKYPISASLVAGVSNLSASDSGAMLRRYLTSSDSYNLNRHPNAVKDVADLNRVMIFLSDPANVEGIDDLASMLLSLDKITTSMMTGVEKLLGSDYMETYSANRRETTETDEGKLDA